MGDNQNKQNEQGRVSTIGGQALLEGVMMRGRGAMAIAVRNGRGDIVLESTRLKPRSKLKRIPLVRGVVSFVESLVAGVGTTMKAAEFLDEEPSEQLSKGGAALAVVLGLLIGVAGFIALPTIASDLLAGWLGFKENILLRGVIAGLLRITLFVLYLFAVSFIKDIKRTFMYHGAEHKTIACFEHNMPLSVANVQKYSTRHDRCGTTFLFIVMIVSMLLFMFVTWACQTIGIPDKIYYNVPIRIALLPFVAGFSYEILFLFARLPDNWFVRVLKAPGLSLQRLTTKQPSDDMIEVAVAAFRAVQLLESDPKLDTVTKGMYYFKLLLEEVQAILEAGGIEGTDDRDFILAEAMNVPRTQIFKYKTVTAISRLNAIDYAKKRASGMPLTFALGSADFCGVKIRVAEGALSPRQETELLAEEAISHSPATALDLCTGSGCIARVLAERTSAKIVAADISDKALEIARHNLEGKGVDIVKSDMFKDIEGRFDLIVCNPPYVKRGDIDGLDSEVKDFDPVIALDGGEDGLDFYRVLAADAPDHLSAGGLLLLEVGQGQADEVCALLDRFDCSVKKDYSGICRIIIARKR